MKTLALLSSAWFLVLAGTVLVMSSAGIPLMLFQHDWEDNLVDTQILLPALAFMLQGTVGVVCGTHLRQLTLNSTRPLKRSTFQRLKA